MAAAGFCNSHNFSCVLFTKLIDSQMEPLYAEQPGATFPYIPLPDEKAGYDINEASDLTPFGISQSKYWTSKDAKELPCKFFYTHFGSYESMLMLDHFRLYVPISACEPALSLQPEAGCRLSPKTLQVSPVRSERPKISFSSGSPQWLYPRRQLPSLHSQRPIAGARIQWILYSVVVFSNNGGTSWFCGCFHP